MTDDTTRKTLNVKIERMSMSTNTPTVDQATGKAADELIAVTGDKTIERLWDLGDSIVAAIPAITTQRTWQTKRELEAIRRHAIDKAGHEEFWSQQRLKQIGTTAARWPKKDRIPDVSVDAHMEALKADDPVGTLRKLAADKKATGSKKPVSIREVRDAIGAGGGTKATRTPTLGKQSPGQLFAEMVIKRVELQNYLRSDLKTHETHIAMFAKLFGELKEKSDQLATGPVTAPTSPTAAPTPAAPPAKKREDKKKRGRLKGI